MPAERRAIPETQATIESAPRRTDELFRNFRFALDIRGVTAGHFTQVEGLGLRVQTIRYREGGANQITHALPGPVDPGEVVLRYGLTTNQDLWTWLQTVVSGRTERRNVSILMLNADGASEGLRWNLINAWPCEWQAAPLDALGRDVAVETIRLAFDQIERV